MFFKYQLTELVIYCLVTYVVTTVAEENSTTTASSFTGSNGLTNRSELGVDEKFLYAKKGTSKHRTGTKGKPNIPDESNREATVDCCKTYLCTDKTIAGNCVKTFNTLLATVRSNLKAANEANTKITSVYEKCGNTESQVKIGDAVKKLTTYLGEAEKAIQNLDKKPPVTRVFFNAVPLFYQDEQNIDQDEADQLHYIRKGPAKHMAGSKGKPKIPYESDRAAEDCCQTFLCTAPAGDPCVNTVKKAVTAARDAIGKAEAPGGDISGAGFSCGDEDCVGKPMTTINTAILKLLKADDDGLTALNKISPEPERVILVN